MLLDLHKAYYNLYHGRPLHTLEVYGAGPKIRGILTEFWSRQEVVTRQNSYHGNQFRENRGTTQGWLAFPTLINIAIVSGVCHWLSIKLEDDAVIHDGLVHAVV